MPCVGCQKKQQHAEIKVRTLKTIVPSAKISRSTVSTACASAGAGSTKVHLGASEIISR